MFGLTKNWTKFTNLFVASAIQCAYDKMEFHSTLRRLNRYEKHTSLEKQHGKQTANRLF